VGTRDRGTGWEAGRPSVGTRDRGTGWEAGRPSVDTRDRGTGWAEGRTTEGKLSWDIKHGLGRDN